MKNLSIKSKLILMVAPSLFVLMIVSGMSVEESLTRKAHAEQLSSRASVFLETSELIHQTQIERGKSSLYMGKKIGANELSDQVKKVDIIFDELSKMETAQKNKSIQEDLEKIKQKTLLIRDDVKNGNAQNAISGFGEKVSFLISFQARILDGISFEGIEGRIKSLTILESSKENMGKLRANLNNIFASGSKKDLSDRDKYQSFLNAIVINLESPGLVISKEGKDAIYIILNSDGWKDVLRAFKVFSEKYQTGDYGVDAVSFSKNITAQIDSVFNIIKQEQNRNLSQLKRERENATVSLWKSVVATLSLILIVTIFSIYTITSLIKQLTSVATELSNSSTNLDHASQNIASVATELSSASTEQASSIQETSSSLEEISSMINNGVENVNNATKLTEQSLRSAVNGKQILEKIVASIKSIDEANESIEKQTEETNKEIGKITQIIDELGSKIKIINEIVFQTKLLSFNASVEAARAGEHGKGFAVVAEEIGNLAQVSGNAAQEITLMLESNTRSIQEIVETSKHQMSKILEESRRKINEGINISKEGEVSFEEILTNTKDISSMIQEISIASNEQAQGVSEINKAIVQLDQATHQNANTATVSSNEAEKVRTLALDTNELINRLKTLISGKS